MSVIDSFLSYYVREYDFYREVARLSEQRCSTELDQNGKLDVASGKLKE